MSPGARARASGAPGRAPGGLEGALELGVLHRVLQVRPAPRVLAAMARRWCGYDTLRHGMVCYDAI